MRNNKNSIYSKKPYDILDNKICCITFGSPRVMNFQANKLFNKLVEMKYIYFKRIIVLKDPIIELPLSTLKYESSYYHPDEDINVKNKNVIISNTNTISKYYTLESHGNYLNILFKGTTLLDPHKEIKRYNLQKKNYSKYVKGYTVCRIIIGGDNILYKAVFFILDDAKVNLDNIDLYKDVIRLMNEEHQDINMTNKTFNHLLHNAHILKNNDLNPLKGTITRLYKDTIKKNNVNCLSAELKI